MKEMKIYHLLGERNSFYKEQGLKCSSIRRNGRDDGLLLGFWARNGLKFAVLSLNIQSKHLWSWQLRSCHIITPLPKIALKNHQKDPSHLIASFWTVGWPGSCHITLEKLFDEDQALKVVLAIGSSILMVEDLRISPCGAFYEEETSRASSTIQWKFDAHYYVTRREKIRCHHNPPPLISEDQQLRFDHAIWRFLLHHITYKKMKKQSTTLAKSRI